MNQFDEEEGHDWWYKKLTAPVQDRRKRKKSGINASDYICGSLYYCKKCDRLWEKAGSSGGAYPKHYIDYFTRQDLSFYGFMNNDEKKKICIRCEIEKEN
tara:strand:+ start:638 stop:937 length:300 start_codon:yes stop_codon:yes gene_type:complete